MNPLPEVAQETFMSDYRAFSEAAFDEVAVAACTVEVSGLPLVLDLVENYEIEKRLKVRLFRL